MLVVGLLVVVAVVSFLFGRMTKVLKIMEISDVFTPNPARSKTQQAQDAVMQLKNEIAKTGAVKFTPYRAVYATPQKKSDCKRVSLKVVLN
jgi:hypothetical protein